MHTLKNESDLIIKKSYELKVTVFTCFFFIQYRINYLLNMYMGSKKE